ncbi:hypothetical protein [Companilactobacillus kimchii]|uniref:Surface layer protein A domain-containing protein n=2 Tax=Companilactobacillus kimchii TaxID=2801452 RepID=A0ABR5NQ52_9LACO|nr:hypothetical protein [Companilactobacillus kimchii]KAE9562707.1 hypothetical protein ATN91_00665 [Companilactobacillus kimchii]KRK49737.1 hypothetical protein FC97_GL002116 [Companilactobacillus kimchii DSM 13961 = JCM 10707]OWF33299.1 hypothetical protein LKACC12383_01367 [Companilactobacillus kimchii]GEO46617.1 hypothetical protein LKI01_06160 [Companilactobacillus paralimentarius]
MDEETPRVKSVLLLPNFYLRVNYDNGQVRFSKSKMYYMETHVFQRPHLGLTSLTPGWYWIGSDIKLLDDNKFSVNDAIYDGNEIYGSRVKPY